MEPTPGLGSGGPQGYSSRFQHPYGQCYDPLLLGGTSWLGPAVDASCGLTCATAAQRAPPLWLPWRPCSPRRRSCQGSSALGAGSRHPQVGASLPGPPNRRVAPLREGLPPCSLLLLVGDRTSPPPSCPCVRSPSENAEHFLEPHSLLSLRNSLAKMGFSIFTLQMRKPRPRRGKLTSLTSKRQSEVSTQDCLNNRKLHSS